MAKAHEVAIGADGRAFDQGIRSGVIKPTEDAVKALEKLEDSAGDAGRGGSADLDKLEASLRDVQKQTEKTERSMDDIGDRGKSGFNKASDATSEFKSEALQNLSEVSSSFTGDIQSIGDLAQGTFGGLASSLPGVLGAAGAGAAVGAGLITSAFVAADEKRKELEERANDLASAYIEAGTTAVDAITIAAKTSEILTDSDKRKQAQAYADALFGGDIAAAARAMAGDVNTLAVANRIAAEAAEENAIATEHTGGSLRGATQEQVAAYLANREAVTAYTELNGVVNDATTKFNDQQAVLRGIIEDAGTASEEVDEFGNTLLTLPDGAQIMIDADTGQATADVSQFKGDVDGIVDTVTTTAVFDDRQARIDAAAFRASVTQRLNIPVSTSTVNGITKPQLLP